MYKRNFPKHVSGFNENAAKIQWTPQLKDFFFNRRNRTEKSGILKNATTFFVRNLQESSSSVSGFLPFHFKVSKRDSPSKEVESIYPEIGATFHNLFIWSKVQTSRSTWNTQFPFPSCTSQWYMNMFSQYTVYHTDIFCLYNLISFVNSKDGNPIYNICIFTSYYLYIIIYHQQACLPNSKAYPKKRQPGSARSIYWTYPFTGRIFSVAAGSIHWRYNSWAKEAGVRKTLNQFIQMRRRSQKRKNMSRTPDGLACQKTLKKVVGLERLNYYY